MSTETNKEGVKEFSQEEIIEMRKKTEAYYDEQIAFMKKQAKFEVLIAEIEEAKVRKVVASLQLSNLMNPYKDEEGAPKKETPKKD